MLHTLSDLKLARVRSVKALLALTYVVLEGPTPRRRLAELLWPQASQPDASLRVALHSLRSGKDRLLDSEEPVASRVPCDALALLHTQGEAVLAGYPGPFLSGVPLEGVSTEFEEWVYAQRERLAAHVQAELLSAARQHPPVQAAALAEQAYRLPGAPAPSAERLAELLALSLPGSPLEAELQRERRDLEADQDEALPSAAPRSRPRRLLGRDQELTRLLDWAAAAGAPGRPPVALISGMGGIGKSALAGALGRELGAQGRHTTFVNAEPLRSAAEVLEAVAQAQPGPPAAPDPQHLARQLGAGHMIVLDGVDGVADLAELLGDWTAAAPELRWVLTGRHGQLGLPVTAGQAERRSGEITLPSGLPVLSVRLGGLPVPEVADDLEELADNPAVQFLLREAGRFQRGLSLTPQTAPHLGSLARRLQGHPLGMLLACGWLAVEPLSDVHARVLSSLSGLHDRTAPERGLQQLGRQTWHLLRPETRRALVELLPFVDFDPADMSAYGVPEAAIDELLNFSLLEAYQSGSERLRLHPTVADLADTAFHGEALDRARERHSAHYLAWFAEQPVAAPQVQAELANVIRAAEHAARQGTLSVPLLERLMSTYDVTLQASSGCDEFSVLADLMVEQGASEQLLATAHIAHMWLAYRAERLLDAQALASWFLSQRMADQPIYRMKALNTLSCVRRAQGQPAVAHQLLKEALHLAQETGEQRRYAFYLINLVGLSSSLSDENDLKEALMLAANAQDIPEDLKLDLKLAVAFATIFYDSAGHDSPGMTDLESFVAPFVAAGNHLQALEVRLHSAYQALFRKEYRLALQRSQSLLGDLEKTPLPTQQTSAYLIQAAAFYHLGRSRQARQSARHAAALILTHGRRYDMIELLIVVAEDLLQSNPTKVRGWLTALANNPNTPYHFRERIAHQLVGFPGTTGDAAPLNLIEAVQDIGQWLKSAGL